MKSLKNILILSALLTGLSANAFEISNFNIQNIKAVQLFDGSTIDFKKEVEEIQFAYDRSNMVDFIQLKEGTVIDSYDIKKLILKNTSNSFNFQNIDYASPSTNYFMVGMMGDGSGG